MGPQHSNPPKGQQRYHRLALHHRYPLHLHHELHHEGQKLSAESASQNQLICLGGLEED